MMYRTLRRKPILVVACLSLLVLVVVLDASRRVNHFTKSVRFSAQSSLAQKCDSRTVILSTKLDSRIPWKSDSACRSYNISHMIPKCKEPIALASFPGSGNTWLRHMIEAAGGVFTGSRYKDLQIQMYGLWGEVRKWNDGTTIVQKTHDASQYHVQVDFKKRGILILRNPYDAILSSHNFLYAGHHGEAPLSNFHRKDWSQFVTIQTSKWLDMATNWTVHSDPSKVLVVHYEDLKIDLRSSMKSILDFVGLPSFDEKRFRCLLAHRAGFFRRSFLHSGEKLLDAFPVDLRQQMDRLIDHVNRNVLIARGYNQMPLNNYAFYNKNDLTIKQELRRRQQQVVKQRSLISESELKDIEEDKAHGTKLVLDQTLKWMSLQKDSGDVTSELLGKTGDISKHAQGFISKALELWPSIQRPFVKDPITDVIEQEGYARGGTIDDLLFH